MSAGESLSASDLLEIEYLCEDYLSHPASHGTTSISRIVRSVADRPWQGRLLLDLLAVDFEARIRRDTNLSHDCLAVRYRGELEWLEQAELFREALCTEFELRSRYGDRPTVLDQFAWAGSTHTEDLLAIYGVLNRLRPLEVTAHTEDGRKLVTAWDQPIIIGRRAKSEPVEFAVVDGVDHRRMIVTKKKYVSRRQVRFIRPRMGQLRVENLGSQLPLRINQFLEIPPGESHEAAKVRRVEFKHVTVEISRPK